jgi:DNA-damage-inducible protein J
MLLTRIAEDGVLPFDGEIVPEAHDQWFRAKVREALDDTRPSLSHEVVEAHFAARREAARAD